MTDHLKPAAPRMTPYLRRITLVLALLLAVIWALVSFWLLAKL